MWRQSTDDEIRAHNKAVSGFIAKVRARRDSAGCTVHEARDQLLAEEGLGSPDEYYRAKAGVKVREDHSPFRIGGYQTLVED